MLLYSLTTRTSVVSFATRRRSQVALFVRQHLVKALRLFNVSMLVMHLVMSWKLSYVKKRPNDSLRKLFCTFRIDHSFRKYVVENDECKRKQPQVSKRLPCVEGRITLSEPLETIQLLR